MRLPKNVTAWEWERARSRVIASSRVCAICGRELWPDAPPRSRWSTAVDHKIPRASFRTFDLRTQRFLCLDPSNLQAAHARCNGRKGKKRQRAVQSRLQSQVW
jgi:5-methylcytosine-specific restriction endonuclease McrA